MNEHVELPPWGRCQGIGHFLEGCDYRALAREGSLCGRCRADAARAKLIQQSAHRQRGHPFRGGEKEEAMKPIHVRRQLVVEVPDDVDVVLLEQPSGEVIDVDVDHRICPSKDLTLPAKDSSLVPPVSCLVDPKLSVLHLEVDYGGDNPGGFWFELDTERETALLELLQTRARARDKP